MDLDPEPTHPVIIDRTVWDAAQRIGAERGNVRDPDTPTIRHHANVSGPGPRQSKNTGLPFAGQPGARRYEGQALTEIGSSGPVPNGSGFFTSKAHSPDAWCRTRFGDLANTPYCTAGLLP